MGFAKQTGFPDKGGHKSQIFLKLVRQTPLALCLPFLLASAGRFYDRFTALEAGCMHH
jgi:hypothetical protein